jgi:hypothetical protein
MTLLRSASVVRSDNQGADVPAIWGIGEREQLPGMALQRDTDASLKAAATFAVAADDAIDAVSPPFLIVLQRWLLDAQQETVRRTL